MKFALLLLAACCHLVGCASIINGVAPTDCYDATSGSVSVVDGAGNVLVAKPAETVHVCPPSFRKVPPIAVVAKRPSSSSSSASAP